MFFSVSPMPIKRHSHGCGLVHDPGRGPEVVVAGGYSVGYSDTVDIYTVNTDTWRAGRIILKARQKYLSSLTSCFQLTIYQKPYMGLLRSLTKIPSYSSGAKILA